MFAAIEQSIVERLKARMDSGVTVTSLAELARVPELRQKAPAVFVVFEGYTEAATNTNVPHIQQIEMSWAVVVAAKNASGSGDPMAAKEDASNIASQVLTALLGFDTGGGRRLVLSQAPGPEYDGGFCYLPIGFSCRATFKGDPV
jgi:phage gp37-like protein